MKGFEFMKKFIAILLCVATMFCLFAGCGSKGDDKTDEKVWKISTDTVFRPFEYKDASGKLVGIDVDPCRYSRGSGLQVRA